MNAQLQLAASNASNISPQPAADLDALLWASLLDSIGEPATAQCVVEFLDERPKELARHAALYLHAKITLRRAAIAHAERMEQARHPLRRLIEQWIRGVPDERFRPVATAVCVTTFFWAGLTTLFGLIG